MAKKHGKQLPAREGKNVWIGKAHIHPQKKGKIMQEIRCVYEVIECITDRDGNRLLVPDITVNSWWTNLKCNTETVIALYHEHATSEQFHSELKHDMDVERLPSGKFSVNKLILSIAMNAYNTLRLLGQKSIEKEDGIMIKRKRLSKVIKCPVLY